MGELLLTLGVLFTLGLAIGSFLNVVIYRSVHNDSPLRGRSYCDSCKKPIRWYDNIPVVSFILLRSRCRYCKAEIPWEYPAVEFLTGALFVWWYVVGFTFFQLGSSPFSVIQPLFWLLVGVLFLVICFADVSYYIIPDSAVILLTGIVIGYRTLLVSQHIMIGHDFLLSIMSGLFASCFFLSLVLLTKGKGMGFGDVKLIIPLALLQGWPNITVGLFLAFCSGAIVGVMLILAQRAKLKQVIPFGPYLIFSTFVTLIFGNELLSWYLHFLH
jgi:leader peptidase (prepilin peptidase)/N-methyltransferase